MTEPRFEPLHFTSEERTLEDISTGDRELATKAMFAAALECDNASFVQTLAVALTLSSEPDIRRAGVLSLGHVARRFGAVELPAVEAIITRLNGDEALHGALYDLQEDLAVFVGREHDDDIR